VNTEKRLGFLDVLLLSLFIVVITYYPYYLHGKINIFEIGLYLPGINAVLHGLVPYRDFFQLRGPLELYVPAAMMSVLGVNIPVLSVYFYVGTVLTLIIAVLIAKEIFKTRCVLYLFAAVLVARTFPRVVFTYWGGMRYALGLLAVFCVVKFFKREKPIWMFFAGIASICGLLTSVEIGVYSVAGVLAAISVSYAFRLQDKNIIWRAGLFYIAGAAVIIVPYVLYLVFTNSFIPFVDTIYAVVIRKETIINQHAISNIPSNLFEALAAMTNPSAKNFRHMTPAYLYLLLAGYLIVEMRNKKLSRESAMLVCIGIYGFVMYNTAFRGIWAQQFEMALQPEKILFFFLLERAYFYLKDKEIRISRIQVSVAFLTLIVFSSLGYSIARYNHRFFAFQYVRNLISGKDTKSLVPLKDVALRPIQIERARGMVVPVEQAHEMESIVNFIDEKSSREDIVFTYPELGTYNFLFDRPFLGRFPIATFSWFNERWHRELISDLETIKPRWVIFGKKYDPNWQAVYLGQEENVKKYNDVVRIIENDYVLVKEMPESGTYIYKHK